MMAEVLIKVTKYGLDLVPEFSRRVEWGGSCLWKVECSENLLIIKIGDVQVECFKIGKKT